MANNCTLNGFDCLSQVGYEVGWLWYDVIPVCSAVSYHCLLGAFVYQEGDLTFTPYTLPEWEHCPCHCCPYNSPTMVELLIDAGACVDTQNKVVIDSI